MQSSRILFDVAGATLMAAAGGWAVGRIGQSSGSQLFGETLVAGFVPNEFALTYDDGPNDNATPALLDVLAKHQVHATFFFIGRFVTQQKELARRVLAAGHLIGNHTFTHPRLSRLSAARIRSELSDCNMALEDTLGARVCYFRPPYGARRPAVYRAAHELGLEVVQWNVHGFDWQSSDAGAIAACIRRGMQRASLRGRSSNILLHDGADSAMGADRSRSIQATDVLLHALLASGHRAVTVNHWDRPPKA